MGFPFVKSLFENFVGSGGEGFWLRPRRRGPRIPAAGCKGRANAGHGQKHRRPEGFRAKGRLASLLAQLQTAAGMRLRSGLAIRPLARKQYPFEFVESRSGAVACRLAVAETGPFGCRCLNSPPCAPFPLPAHQTGRARFGHPAFVKEDSCFRTRATLFAWACHAA